MSATAGSWRPGSTPRISTRPTSSSHSRLTWRLPCSAARLLTCLRALDEACAEAGLSRRQERLDDLWACNSDVACELPVRVEARLGRVALACLTLASPGLRGPPRSPPAAP